MIITDKAEYEGYGFLLSDYWGFELDEENSFADQRGELTTTTDFKQAAVTK